MANNNTLYLWDIPNDEITKEKCLLALEHSLLNFDYIPPNIMDNELIEYGLTHGCNVIRHLPNDHPVITKEFCIRQITYYPETISMIPEEFMDDDMVELAITTNDNDNYVSIRYHLLTYIPIKYRTLDRCLKFLNMSIYAFRFIPGTTDIDDIDDTGDTDTDNTNDVEDILGKNFDIIIDTIVNSKRESNHCPILRYMPEKYITKELCVRFLSNNLDILNNIPIHILDEELLIYAITKTEKIRNLTRIIDEAPDNLITQNVIDCAVEHGLAFHLVPERFITKELCKRMLEKSPNNFYHMPIEILDEESSLFAVSKNKGALSRIVQKIPLENISLELCIASFKHRKNSIRCLPEDMQKVVVNTVRNNSSMVKSAIN